MGILAPDARTELIDGLILTKPPFTPPHISSVNRLNVQLVRLIGDLAIVSVQNCVRLDDGTEPEPDIALISASYSEGRLPTAADTLLVVEVAETTEAYDRGIKMTRYAAAGIPEAWLVLPSRRRVDVFRQPGPGGYASTTEVPEAGSLSIAAFPDLGMVSVHDVLPPDQTA